MGPGNTGPFSIMDEVKIALDKERSLKLTLNAMVKFEEATGKSLLKEADLFKMTATDLRALLWACLLHEDKALTLDQVGDMIDISNINIVAKKLGDAWTAALPESKELSPNAQSRPNG